MFGWGIFMATLLAEAKVTTLVGTGVAGDNTKQIHEPFGLVLRPDGKLYFCDLGNHKLKTFELSTSKLETLAGSGSNGVDLETVPALQAAFTDPHEIRFAPDGKIMIAERLSHLVKLYDPVRKTISPLIGIGKKVFSSNVSKLSVFDVKLNQPLSIDFTPQGDLLVCDTGAQHLFSYNDASQTVEVFAGNGLKLPVVDGQQRLEVSLNGPRTISHNRQGRLFIVLREGNCLLRVDLDGSVHRVGGTGKKGFTGDGGPALEATFNGPKGLAISETGDIYIADTENHVIRKISGKTGLIETVLGTGVKGDGPEEAPTSCALARPHGVYFEANKLYVSDTENHRIRVVTF